MKEEKEYAKHIVRRWSFAKEIAEKLADTETRKDLTLSIFDKVCTPLYYFLQGETSQQPPTEKQIAYAKQLGIAEPEIFSREALSLKIDEALQSKKKNREGNYGFS